VIKGETPVKERQRLFDAFRSGEEGLLVVSQGRELLRRPARAPRWRSRCRAPSAHARRRPSASAGCCARSPTGKSARFYTIVSRDTVDADFAQNRQRFLAEQGYAYRIVDADDIVIP
jgi:DNA excision repair protein ERCC-3